MNRQGLSVSIKELKDLIKEFRKEQKSIGKLVGRTYVDKWKDRMKFLVPIVNYPTQCSSKQKYCSDTWEIESDKNG